jgi:hypothetical protein
MSPQCVDRRAHDRDETLLRARSLSRRRQLLSSYLLNLQMGACRVREMIMRDIGSLRDLGAHQLVDDLEVVLDSFLSRYPEAGAPRRAQETCGAFAAEPA